MHQRPRFVVLTSVLVGMFMLLPGCATRRDANGGGLARMPGESVVLIGTQPAQLTFTPASAKDIRVHSRYVEGAEGTVYEAGSDYTIDLEHRSITRTSGSRIPDFRSNMLFGKEDFDHSKFPGFGNTGFFAFVDYSYAATNVWPRQAPQTALLPKSAAKLQTAAEFKIVAYGDSITAGGDATKPEWIFWKRWAAALQTRHPQARVTAINGATGGDSTVQGLQRLRAKVLEQKPDLVLIGFGMNDHNKGGVPIPKFEENLKSIIAQIRASTGAEVLLFSAFPPNPRWRFGSHQMEAYAAATEKVARETGSAFADVFRNWQTFAERKKPEDLLGNNINHPNDFGHWIYFRVLEATGL